MRSGNLFLGCVLVILLLMAPVAAADAASYRPIPPPSPPSLVPSFPPAAPSPPCTVNGAAIDCNPLVNWAVGPLAAWAIVESQATQQRILQAETWVFSVSTTDEFTFLGPSGTSSATIHVHDLVTTSTVHNNVLVSVRGGPGGERWFCKHTCSVPDSGFTVSIDPQDVPNNIWEGFDPAFPLPNLPATSGTLTVTFS